MQNDNIHVLRTSCSCVKFVQ